MDVAHTKLEIPQDPTGREDRVSEVVVECSPATVLCDKELALGQSLTSPAIGLEKTLVEEQTGSINLILEPECPIRGDLESRQAISDVSLGCKMDEKCTPHTPTADSALQIHKGSPLKSPLTATFPPPTWKLKSKHSLGKMADAEMNFMRSGTEEDWTYYVDDPVGQTWDETTQTSARDNFVKTGKFNSRRSSGASTPNPSSSPRSKGPGYWLGTGNGHTKLGNKVTPQNSGLSVRPSSSSHLSRDSESDSNTLSGGKFSKLMGKMRRRDATNAATEPSDEKILVDGSSVVNLTLAVATLAELQDKLQVANRQIEQLMLQKKEVQYEANTYRKRYSNIRTNFEIYATKKQKQFEAAMAREKTAIREERDQKLQEMAQEHALQLVQQKDQIQSCMMEIQATTRKQVEDESYCSKLTEKELECQFLKKNYESALADLGVCTAELNNTKQLLSDLQEKFTSLQSEYLSKEQLNTSLLESIESLKKESLELEEKLCAAETKANISSLKRKEENKAVTQKNIRLEDANNKLQSKITEMSQEQEKLKTILEQMKQKVKLERNASKVAEMIQVSDSLPLAQQIKIQQEVMKRLEAEVRQVRAKSQARAGVLKQTAKELMVTRDEAVMMREAYNQSKEAVAVLSEKNEFLKLEIQELRRTRQQENHMSAKIISDLSDELTSFTQPDRGRRRTTSGLRKNGCSYPIVPAPCVIPDSVSRPIHEEERYFNNQSPVSSLGMEPYNQRHDESEYQHGLPAQEKNKIDGMEEFQNGNRIEQDRLLEAEYTRIALLLTVTAEEKLLLHCQTNEVSRAYTELQLKLHCAEQTNKAHIQHIQELESKKRELQAEPSLKHNLKHPETGNHIISVNSAPITAGKNASDRKNSIYQRSRSCEHSLKPKEWSNAQSTSPSKSSATKHKLEQHQIKKSLSISRPLKSSSLRTSV